MGIAPRGNMGVRALRGVVLKVADPSASFAEVRINNIVPYISLGVFHFYLSLSLFLSVLIIPKRLVEPVVLSVHTRY